MSADKRTIRLAVAGDWVSRFRRSGSAVLPKVMSEACTARVRAVGKKLAARVLPEAHDAGFRSVARVPAPAIDFTALYEAAFSDPVRAIVRAVFPHSAFLMSEAFLVPMPTWQPMTDVPEGAPPDIISVWLVTTDPAEDPVSLEAERTPEANETRSRGAIALSGTTGTCFVTSCTRAYRFREPLPVPESRPVYRMDFSRSARIDRATARPFHFAIPLPPDGAKLERS